jgi:hypothetical protein
LTSSRIRGAAQFAKKDGEAVVDARGNHIARPN